MIVIVIFSNTTRQLSVNGPYCTFERAAQAAEKFKKDNKEWDCFVVNLYERNKYGAPVYPFPLDDTGDD